MPVIEPLHEPSCACPMCVARRKAMVESSNPLMQKRGIEPTMTSSIIPRDEAIANAREELEFHLGCAGRWRRELDRLGGME